MFMLRKEIMIGLLIALMLSGAGVFILSTSLTPLEKKDVLLNDSFDIPGNAYENRTAWIGSSGEYIAFFTVSPGTIKFFPMTPPELSLWLEGKYEPAWIEKDHADLGMGLSIGEGEGHLLYFVFVNDDMFTKQVHVRVTRVWQELNYTGLLGGVTIILAAAIVSVIVIHWLRRPIFDST